MEKVSPNTQLRPHIDSIKKSQCVYRCEYSLVQRPRNLSTLFSTPSATGGVRSSCTFISHNLPITTCNTWTRHWQLFVSQPYSVRHKLVVKSAIYCLISLQMPKSLLSLPLSALVAIVAAFVGTELWLQVYGLENVGLRSLNELNLFR